MPTQGICKFCNRPVYWAYHKKGTQWGTLGTPMPVDVEPVDGGNVILTANKDHAFYRVLKIGETPKEGEKRRVSHLATCPEILARKARAKVKK